MRIDLPMCNFKNCKWYFDGNCHKKTRDYCEYHWQKTEIERLKSLLDSQCDHCSCTLLDERDKLRGEVEDLKIESTLAVKDYKDMVAHLTGFYRREAERDVIRKFAEKVKEQNGNNFIEEWYESADLCHEFNQEEFAAAIDVLVNEMLEEIDNE